jgi:hypothetical protein
MGFIHEIVAVRPGTRRMGPQGEHDVHPGGDQVDGGGQRGPVLEVEGAAAALLREHADDAVAVAPGPRPDFTVLVGNRGPRLDLPAGADPRIADQPHRRPPFVHSALGRSYRPGEAGFRLPANLWVRRYPLVIPPGRLPRGYLVGGHPRRGRSVALVGLDPVAAAVGGPAKRPRLAMDSGLRRLRLPAQVSGVAVKWANPSSKLSWKFLLRAAGCGVRSRWWYQ